MLARLNMSTGVLVKFVQRVRFVQHVRFALLSSHIVLLTHLDVDLTSLSWRAATVDVICEGGTVRTYHHSYRRRRSSIV